MTCVVGIELGAGHVLLGADSASAGGTSLTIVEDPKVFHRAPFVMGFTTSWRMGSLLRYGHFDPDMRRADENVDRFMHTTFIDAVRTCLKDGGFAKVDNNVEKGGTFLVGFRGRLYRIGSDFQVARGADPFAAVGCGADLALGALRRSTSSPTSRRCRRC